MSKRLILFLFTALLAAALLASCGEDKADAPASVTTADAAAQEETTEAVETQLQANVPEKDFGGAAFRICSYQHPSYATIGNFEFYVESENGEVVNDAVFRRNQTIEERFNMEIKEEKQGDTVSTLTKAVAAGDEPFDIYVILHQNAGGAMMNGNMYNIREMNYIDLNMPWWSRELGEGMTINGRLYFVSGDYLLYEKKRTYCLFFNKDMIRDLGIDSPYDSVFDNAWTLDVLHGMMQGVASDLDGDGTMTPENDRWGLVLSAYANTYGFLMGADINAVTEKNGEYQFTLYSDRLVSMLDKLIAIASDNTIAFASGTPITKGDWSGHTNTFLGNRALFNSSIVSGIQSTVQNAEFDFGVLPMPKFDEKQATYRTSSDRELSAVIVVPVNDADPDMTGILLEALSAESHYTTRVAYIETACKTKYSYDEETVRVLDIIFDNTYYNLGTFFNLGDMNTVLRGIIEKGENTISSSYASIETKAVKDLEKLISFFEE